MSERSELIMKVGLPAALPCPPNGREALSTKFRFAHANAEGDGRRQEAMA